MEGKITKITQQLDTLKLKSKELVLAVGKNEPMDKIHSMSIDILLEITELEKIFSNINIKIQSSGPPASYSVDRTPRDTSEIEAEEIDKVARKLPKWARNQQQINSKILNLFIELSNNGKSTVSEEVLMKQYGNQSEFYRNFNQMKIISPKNHAKVFDVKNGIVEIWKPVREYIDEYKKLTFDNGGR